MLELIAQGLSQLGLADSWADLAARGLFIVLILLLALLADFIARRYVLHALTRVIRHSRWRWDDALLSHNVLRRIAHFAPAIVIYLLAPVALEGYEAAGRFVSQVVLI